MKLNLLKTSALLCGLFLLASCAQEAPQVDNKIKLEDGPRVAVPIELEVSVDAFDAAKALDQEGRAYTGAKTPITVKDGSKGELNDDLFETSIPQKVLTRSRAKFIEKNKKLDVVVKIDINQGGTINTYIGQANMSYDAGKDKYTFGGSIDIPESVVDQAKKPGAINTITLYAGGEYNETYKTFTIPSVMEEVSLANLASTPIDLPILYKSAPITFKVDGGALKPMDSSSAGTLKPLGSLLLLTFRNNMQQGVTFDGVTAVTNSFFGPNNREAVTTYKIEDGKFSTISGYTSSHAKSSAGGSTYTYFFKDFASAGFSVPTGGVRSDKAILFWGVHEGTSQAASASNKLTEWNGNSLKADILTPATSVLHVYGQNVKVGGRTPSRPNYSIAPIGGANLTPQNGKAYTLNCEFYDQAPQMLGYFAKSYLYNDSGWKFYDRLEGNGSSDPATYQAIGDDHKLLVNAKDAKHVRDNGVNLNDGRGKMLMPNESWFYLYGLKDPVEFQTGGARYKAVSSFTSSYRGYVLKTLLPYKDDPSESTPFQYKDFVYADYHDANQTVSEGGLAVVYRQLYMAPRNSQGLQPRSKYQTIMRVQTRGVQDYITGDGQAAYNIYPGALTMESLYVGKYFVGNVMTAPLYVTRDASQPFLYAEDGDLFWRKPEVALDRVERAMLNVRTFAFGQIGPNDMVLPSHRLAGKTRAEAHLAIHWCDGAMEREFMDNSSTSSALNSYINKYIKVRDEYQKILNRTYGFADPRGGIWTINRRSSYEDISPRLRSNTYQALRPYSQKYQGNEGFRNNNN